MAGLRSREKVCQECAFVSDSEHHEGKISGVRIPKTRFYACVRACVFPSSMSVQHATHPSPGTLEAGECYVSKRERERERLLWDGHFFSCFTGPSCILFFFFFFFVAFPSIDNR